MTAHQHPTRVCTTCSAALVYCTHLFWTVATLEQPASPLTPLLYVTACCLAADKKASGSSVHHCCSHSSKHPRRPSRSLLCTRLRLLLLCTAARLLLGRLPLLAVWLCQQPFLLCPQFQPPQARSPAQIGRQYASTCVGVLVRPHPTCYTCTDGTLPLKPTSVSTM